MKKFLTLIIFTLSLNSFALLAVESDLHIQIRSEVAAATTEKGQSFFGSYLYALVSGSSVKTDLYFSGNPQEVINIIGDLFEKDDTDYVEIASISYGKLSDRIDMILVDNFCASEYETEDCLYTIQIPRMY